MEQQNESIPVPQAPEIDKKKYVLIVHNRKDNIENRYELDEHKEYLVGADPQNSSIPILEDSFLSWRHCKIKRSGDTVEVEDLGSKNGLYLKLDEPIGIVPGQSLLVGSTLIRLETEDGQPS